MGRSISVCSSTFSIQARRSELSIADFEAGGFAEGFAVSVYPVGDVVEQLRDRDFRQAVFVVRNAGVVEQRGGGFFADEFDRAAQAFGQLLADGADAESFGAGDIDD